METAASILMMESKVSLNPQYACIKIHGCTFRTSITFSLTALETLNFAFPFYPPMNDRFSKLFLPIMSLARSN